jgi:hypothetical protein
MILASFGSSSTTSNFTACTLFDVSDEDR